MSSVTVRGDLTDKQWARLRRWIPGPAPTGRPITRSRRTLFNGVAWPVRAGSPWRDVPERYGPWPTVYPLFATWQRTGIWALMVKMILALLDHHGRLTWTVSVDSTTVRAHQAAAGAGSRAVPGEPDDHALGRSRGGWTTKVHLAADTDQAIMSMQLTAGQRGDSPQFQPVLEHLSVPRPGPGRPRKRPRRVLADKAYPSKANRRYLRKRGIQAVIPEKKDHRRNRIAKGRAGGRPPAFDPEAYKERNTVERAIGRLKRYRAVSTRYDKLAVRYEATIQVAIILDWKPSS
ncbi:IS5 family transposase [Glycomyces arizonensis]|uniref:IS5 family transposase n=1 Tax=Glycomyces arizonensis TaxID=256035 RepID=UPI0004124785|nr:IS5 family transposase [Glycomyces arizonensis]